MSTKASHFEPYRNELIGSFQGSGWEIRDVNSEGIGWWADEVLVLKSVREQWGLQVTITWLVDPQFDGRRQKGEGIWAIAATPEIPVARQSAQAKSIALMRLSRAGFQKRLETFVATVNQYRRELPSQECVE